MTTMPEPLAPTLEHAFTIELQLTAAQWVRPSAMGESRGAVFVASGSVTGPRLRGRVIPMSGGDYPLVRPNGVIDFDARYLLEAEDGAIIYMQNRGYRWASAEVMERLRRNEPVPSHEYYMRVSPKFDAPAGPHEWLAQHVFVGTAEKVPHGNRIHYFMVR